MNECPFCGADWDKDINDGAGHPHKIYMCGTAVYAYNRTDANRSLICRKLAQYAALLRRALEALEDIVAISTAMDNIHPEGLPAKYRQAYEGILFMAPKAQAVAPDLRKALEERWT